MFIQNGTRSQFEEIPFFKSLKDGADLTLELNELKRLTAWSCFSKILHSNHCSGASFNHELVSAWIFSEIGRMALGH